LASSDKPSHAGGLDRQRHKKRVKSVNKLTAFRARPIR